MGLKAVANSGGGSGGGVSSINSITGAVTLVAGSNITLTPSGQDITIASTGGGGGTPGGTNGQLQFNDSSAFGGANITYGTDGSGNPQLTSGTGIFALDSDFNFTPSSNGINGLITTLSTAPLGGEPATLGISNPNASTAGSGYAAVLNLYGNSALNGEMIAMRMWNTDAPSSLWSLGVYSNGSFGFNQNGQTDSFDMDASSSVYFPGNNAAFGYGIGYAPQYQIDIDSNNYSGIDIGNSQQGSWNIGLSGNAHFGTTVDDGTGSQVQITEDYNGPASAGAFQSWNGSSVAATLYDGGNSYLYFNTSGDGFVFQTGGNEPAIFNSTGNAAAVLQIASTAGQVYAGILSNGNANIGSGQGATYGVEIQDGDGTYQYVKTGRLLLQNAGAVSASQIFTTASLYTGGSGTTTYPFWFINQGTSVTTWSTSGTEIGINAPTSFAGNFLDFRVNGGTSSQFQVNSRGIMNEYAGVATVGLGIPAIYGAGLNVSLNTTSTAVASYTPTSASGQHFSIRWVLSCKTSSTPTLQVTFTDPNAGAQTVTLYNTAMTSNTVTQGIYTLTATSGAAIAVTGSDGTALGDIYATATIEELQ